MILEYQHKEGNKYLKYTLEDMQAAVQEAAKKMKWNEMKWAWNK